MRHGDHPEPVHRDGDNSQGGHEGRGHGNCADQSVVTFEESQDHGVGEGMTNDGGQKSI